MKNQQLFIHRYDLQRKNVLQTQMGALLKVVDIDGNYGVADICPWPVLGDLTLKEELEGHGPLFQRALDLALKDQQARKNKIKLNLEVPVKNHFLVAVDQDLNDLKKYHGQTLKIKANSLKLQEISLWLNQNSHFFSKIRLDFNAQLSADQFFQFVNELAPGTRDKIECVEDPFPFDPKLWEESSLKLARDFEKAEWPHKIIKPAREALTNKDFLYLTSSMDHPVGVTHGLVEAQQFPQLTHGFLTLDLYKPTEFNSCFKQENEFLSYQSEGYGIGFEKEIQQIIWEPWVNYHKNSDNQIFWGSHFSTQEKQELLQIKEYFDQNTSPRNYFLIPSSGSSHQQNESLKVFAIPKDHFLNAASRVNMQFNLTQDMSWGCVLPTYHVGGISILARAHLAHSKVYFNTWKNFSVDWIMQNNIQLLSLVPTQLYDLVKARTKCPKNIKYLFIGGAHLSDELQAEVQSLGWPLVVTYGMTETSAMIASRPEGKDYYLPFQGVDISASEDSKLQVRCNSLAEYSLQIKEGAIASQSLSFKGYYQAEDQVDLIHQGFRFVQRGSEQIKINGEGVSLFNLRQKLELVLNQFNVPWEQCTLTSVPDQRSGEKLVLIFAKDATKTQEEKQMIVKSYNELVKPYERISKMVTMQTALPMTELQKIKHQQLKEQVQAQIAKENT